MGDIFLAYLIFILAQSAQLIMRNAIVQTLVTVFIFPFPNNQNSKYFT